jgi:hypothetical protein
MVGEKFTHVLMDIQACLVYLAVGSVNSAIHLTLSCIAFGICDFVHQIKKFLHIRDF